MKDHERLELLKEIGGTKVYEERRKESLKILHETNNRRSRILEVVILELWPCHQNLCCNDSAPFGAFQAAVGILCPSPRRSKICSGSPHKMSGCMLQVPL